MKDAIFALLLFCSIFGLSRQVQAQTDNFRAQGFYYKAKALKESGKYSSAIPYCKKAEDALGGSNLELQYLYILCYYYNGDYLNAQKEMRRFFDFKGSKKDKIVRFDKSVDRITDDETKAVTKLMVDIDEKAKYEETHVTCNRCHGDGTESYQKDCSYCGGNGYKPCKKTCSQCNGRGGKNYNHGTAVGTKWHDCFYCGGKGYDMENCKCNKCYGKGYDMASRTCTQCHGKGKVAKE